MKRLFVLFAIVLTAGMLTLTACEPVDEEEMEQMQENIDNNQDGGGSGGGGGSNF